MAVAQFLSQAVLCVFVLRLCRTALAFPLHAAALEDNSVQSGFAEAEGNLEVNGLSEEYLVSILKDEASQRLHALGEVSDSQDFLQRTFMSPAALRAAQLIRSWMTDAGLFTWTDDIGNVHGRFDGVLNPHAPALLLGSHLDTVIDAGRYDGALGLVTAIAAVKALHYSGRLVDFPRPIEVIAFSDEEGIRFQSTFLGSGPIAGTLGASLLQCKDKSNVTIQEALRSASFPGTPASLTALKYDPESVWGYVEVHIEQGPVLYSKNLPLGVVDAIAGQNRLRVSMKGMVGHAGTVPMRMRRDPMPAAALAITAIDELCMHPEDTLMPAAETSSGSVISREGALVCTVGDIAALPGASNVIPAEVVFSVDVRAKSDWLREAAISKIEFSIHEICKNRAISCAVEHKHEAQTVQCDSVLTQKLRASASSATNQMSNMARAGKILMKELDAETVPIISSGAGHDALAMAQLTKVGMIFVRCAGGMSHSPFEFVLDDDTMTAGVAVLSFLQSELQPAKLSSHLRHQHQHWHVV